ncbi:uncharacterized protein LOC128268347 [Anopheles cruzii]|uniref:uncharacterized protein LOC128268347 n=1 Tax=Anopheles cruzii TaxID=68878 RepID=UPI0022EC3293|nr:uncharacterized protein LOC128268347 [Anopheles cruzii]
MTMTLEKLSTGSGVGGLATMDRHRRSTDSCTPVLMDNFYIDIPTPSTRSVSPLSSSVSPGKDKSFSFFRSVYRKISLKSHDELNQLGTTHGDEDSHSSSVDSCSSISDHHREHLPSSAAKSHDGADDDGEYEEDQLRYSRNGSRRTKLQMQLRLSELAALSGASSEMTVNGVKEAGGDVSGSGVQDTRRKSRRSSVLKLLESLAISAPIRSRSLSCSSSSVNNLLHGKGRDSRTESKCSLFSTNSNGANGERSKESNKPPPKKILRRPVSYTYLRGISGLPTQRVPRSSICCSYYGR